MKQINFLIIVILVGLLCTSYTCTRSTDDCHKKIVFVNNSSKDVYIHGGWYSDTLRFASLFPNPYNQPDLYRAKSGEKNTNGLTNRSCFETYIKQGEFIVYVFDAEVLANYSGRTIFDGRDYYTWGVIGRDYMVLKTIRPTFEEMQNNNWTITYTGD